MIASVHPRPRGRPGVRPLACAGLTIAVAAIVAVVSTAQQPSFSSRADYVRVDAEVRRSNTLVTGLKAADFEVLDNGVPQQIEIVAPSAFPVSVVLTLDTSASLGEKERAHLAQAGIRVIDALKSGESAALITFSDRIRIRSRFTADAGKLRELVAVATPSGDTALYDAAHTAMLVGTAAPGRSIVILFSDGDDTASFLTEDALLETAQRTGSVVCVVALGATNGLLQQLATTTGGMFVHEKSLDRVAARFVEILESFRNRYLLSFAPTGIEKRGWHKLTVRVKGGGDVRARRGYWGGS
jgi:VWFA-related protein